MPTQRLRAGSLLAAAFLIHALPAQRVTTFVSKLPPIIRITANDIPALLASLPKTALGRLLAEPDVAEAFATAQRSLHDRHARADEILRVASDLKLTDHEALIARALRRLEPNDLARFEVLVVPQNDEQPAPRTVIAVSPTPKSEGRLAREFAALVADLGKANDIRRADDGKFAGFPTHVFLPPEADEPDFPMPGFEPAGVFAANLPGLLLGGDGTDPEAYGAPGTAKATPAGLELAIDFTAYLRIFEAFGGGIGGQAERLGVANLRTFSWRVAFAGEQLLDELQIDIDGEPKGIFAGLLTGKAALPAQPLPAGALLQCRLAVDVPALLEALVALSDGLLSIPDELAKDLTAALDGGLALGVAAPAPGGVLPRLFLSARVADAAALERVLAATRSDGKGVEIRSQAIENQPCTVWKLGDLPPAMQPTVCIRDGTLHLTESPTSMRALLQQLATGATAMSVGAAPLPAGPTEPLRNFEIALDAGAAYRAFHDIWLPLWELSPAAGQDPPLLTRADLPEPEVVADHLPQSRGILRRTPEGWLLQHQGPIGGVMLAAAAITYGPLLSTWVHEDSTSESLTRAIAKNKLDAAFLVLEAWRKEHGSLPATLAELFAAGKLVDEALLLPGDPLAEEVPVPGRAKPVRSSFRWFPKGVDVEGAKVLLIGIAPMRWRRPMLAEDGSQPDTWGEESRQPIDRFGK
ncbi:MAG: hypothetical protein IPK26_17345 [Planctomycetes bacterium]|nr:hypothetical protein [Planctomycetota bacterium]